MEKQLEVSFHKNSLFTGNIYISQNSTDCFDNNAIGLVDPVTLFSSLPEGNAKNIDSFLNLTCSNKVENVIEHTEHVPSSKRSISELNLEINSHISSNYITVNDSSGLKTLVNKTELLCKSNVLNDKDQKLVHDVSESGTSKDILINRVLSPVKQYSSGRKRHHSLISAELAEPESIEEIQKSNSNRCQRIDNTVLSAKFVHKSVSGKEHHLSEKEKFIYGNYNAYYGYRNADNPTLEDVRIQSLPLDLFRGHDVLDIGCNVGHVTLCIARDYSPRMITGIDIDRRLIAIAKKNIRHYIASVSESVKKCSLGDAVDTSKQVVSEQINVSSKSLNIKLLRTSGHAKDDDNNDVDSIEKGKVLTVTKMTSNDFVLSDTIRNHECKNLVKNDSVFPHNVMFQTLNYVPETELVVDRQNPEYDVILALSVSKWIHLNHADAGLKLAFRRMYAQLRMGGALVLEAQPWSSYGKKKKLTADIFRVYQSIKFYPEQFKDYLLSDQVGFTSHKIIGVPFNKSKGFQRSIEMFIK